MSRVLSQGRKIPLPITLATTALLLLGPTLALHRWPRSQADGLERLMATASLVQSLPAAPERPLPALWRERLGESLAIPLWGAQRRPWWQFWGAQSQGGPYLAFTSNGGLSRSRSRLPPNSQRIGDLVVVAPDPAAHRILAERLRTPQRRSRGLQGRCLERLARDQAVFWNPSALATIVGPLAPLLQRFQEGCLVLSLDPLQPAALRWQGEASAVDGVLTQASDLPLKPSESAEAVAPLSEDLLIELRGASLEQLLQGLLSRQLVREPLASRYGIDKRQLEMLRRAPFRLRLRPQSQGRFQASLELQVQVGGQRREWEALLARLAGALRGQGLRTTPAKAAPMPSRPAGPEGLVAWQNEDGEVMGGWGWMPISAAPPQLIFFLGPPPLKALREPGSAGAGPAAGELWLRSRPDALATLGLLPIEMPDILKRSKQLWITARPMPGSDADGPISLLSGGLQVQR